MDDVDEARHEADEAKRSPAAGLLLTVGLTTYGLVHLLIGWVAGKVAWTGSGEQASQRGALNELAEQRFGAVVLWAIALGMAILVCWQVVDALVGYRNLSGRKRVLKRLSSCGRAALYAYIGASAFRLAAGFGQGAEEKTMSARLMSTPPGPALVIAIGVVVLAVGARLLLRGVTAGFTDDLAGDVSAGVVVVGRIGYLAKGVAFGVAGVLFGWAGATYDPNKAGGLDTALRTIGDRPFGPELLTVTAVGIGFFGLYCLAWSRNAKR